MRVSIYVDPRQLNRQGEMSVYLSVSGNGKRFLVNTGLTSKEKFTGTVFPKSVSSSRAKSAALSRYFSLAEDLCLSNPNMPAESLKNAIREIVGGKHTGGKVLCDYIHEYAETKSDGTKEIYARTEKRVRQFDPTATFDSVNRSWLDRFVSVGCHELSVNSTSIHLRNIRAVFNRAIDDGVTTCYPFRRFRIKTERVPVGNITAKQLAAIRDYPCDSWIAVYRDLFMLSFYLCGANAADMLQCRSLTNGRFVYRRKKTGRLYDLPVYPEAMRIIEKYRGKEYLLNIMDSHSDYHSFTAIWNENLKKIGPAEKVPDRLGKMRKVIYHPIVPGLTTYTARYTFASIAAEIDIPRDIIALCLGHAWADVTDRYISYGREKVDEAVRKVIDYVNSIHDKA